MGGWKRRRRQALGILGPLALWIASEFASELLPRLGGSYVRRYIIAPSLLAFAWLALDKKLPERVRNLHWNLQDYHPLPVLITSGAVTILLAFVVTVAVNFPPAQPPGHGRLAGSLPDPPLAIRFPLPKSLPPPEVVEKNRPTPKPKVRQRELSEIAQASIEALIAQLPVEEVVENEMAPHLAPLAAAPFNLRIINSR